MRKILTIWILLLCQNVQAQTKQSFIDSFERAIIYYKDFLVKLDKGQQSFNRGKRLFGTSEKLLNEIQSQRGEELDEDNYKTFLQAVKKMRSINFQSFLATERRLKDKQRIDIDGRSTILSVDNGIPLAIVLDILLEDLKEIR